MMKLGKGYFMLFLLYFVVFRLSCGVVFQMSCVVVSGFRLFIFFFPHGVLLFTCCVCDFDTIRAVYSSSFKQKPIDALFFEVGGLYWSV